MTSKDNVVTCPHCGNRTPHSELNRVRVVDEIEVDGNTYDYTALFGLYQCSTCDTPSLYLATEDDFSGDPNEKYLDVAALVYPDQKKLEDSVPEKVRKNYLEARKVKKISYASFAVLIGRVLEQVCLDQKAKGRTLRENLEDLAKREIIPKNLASMTDILRTLRNVSAHANDYDIEWEEVNAMDDFLVAIIEYVYVAPEKIKRLNESMKKKRRAGR